MLPKNTRLPRRKNTDRDPPSTMPKPKPASQTPRNQLPVGDCIQLMNSWPEDSVDLVFADPPYNIGFSYDQYDDTKGDEEYVQWTQDWISAVARVLKPSGSFYILIGDEYAAETRMHLKKLESEGKLAFRNWIIWHYTFGQNCRSKFNRSHAHLFYCVGSAALKQTRSRSKRQQTHSRVAGEGQWTQKVDVKNPPFAFNKEAVAVPSARQTTYKDARANPTGKLPDDTWYLRPQQVDEEGIAKYFQPDEDTWYLSRLCGTFKERVGWHPCQLPEALLERIVKLSSNKGDLVFDPFSGSGTTLAVAARLDRDWLGCDVSDEYAAKAIERITHVSETGEALQTSYAAKGIKKGKPKKKAEPDRSPHLRKKTTKKKIAAKKKSASKKK